MTLVGAQRGYVRGVAFVPGGETIAAVSDDNQLRLWDTTSGKLLKAFPALSDRAQAGLPRTLPNSLAISPDGRLIAVGGGGTTDKAHVIREDETSFFEVRVLDARTGELVWTHLGRRGFMCQLAFSPDGTTLASATSGEVKIWDAKAGDPMQSLKPKSGTVWALAFSPDNRLLAGCGATRAEGKRRTWLTLWDVRSGAIIHSIDAGEAGGATAPGTLAFSPDGKSLASAGVGIFTGRFSIGGRDVGVGQKVINNIKLWDVVTGRLVWTLGGGRSWSGDVTGVLAGGSIGVLLRLVGH
jgi:WD40 repeat protein